MYSLNDSNNKQLKEEKERGNSYSAYKIFEKKIQSKPNKSEDEINMAKKPIVKM